MSQPFQNNHPSDSEIDYDIEIHVHEEDEEDWQDAEEQHTAAVPIQPKLAEQKTIDETELRRKIKAIQQNIDLSSREKAKQIQVCNALGRIKKTTKPIAIVPNVSWYYLTSTK